MHLVGEPAVSHGVMERRFDVDGATGTVPGLLWTPEGATGARPLVLVGHGGGANKRTPYVLSLARRLVRHSGYAVAAIDGVGHGDRAGTPMPTDDELDADGRSGFVGAVARAAGAMIDDWTVTLGELRKLDEVGHGFLGYWGLSMGTMFGAPFVAATPEVQCAVLGLMGTFGGTNPWTAAVANIACPVLFLVQTDDELIPPEQALALFRALGTKDKRMHAHPGAHSAVPSEEIDASEAFFAQHLS